MIETSEVENLPVVAERLPEGRQAGIAALSQMSEAEFEIRILAMRKGRERIERVHKELMRAESDYGVVPGTNRPTLLKPGAEKLAQFYGLAAEFRLDIQHGDGVERPTITVVVECRLHLGDLEGPVVNTGCGVANSWEKRFRYRRGERVCPQCGKEGTLLRSKNSPDYFCWLKKGGCGATFALDDDRITRQVVGDVENEDPYDLLNTLAKMGEKRSYVNACLRASATSSLYTQDLDEFPELAQGGSRSAPNAPQSAPEARPAPPAAAAPPKPNPRAKAALEAAERPIEVRRAPAVPPEGVDENELHPDDDSPQEFTVCEVADCGTILSDEELRGCARWATELGGRWLCKIHGQEAKAAYREAQAIEPEAHTV